MIKHETHRFSGNETLRRQIAPHCTALTNAKFFPLLYGSVEIYVNNSHRFVEYLYGRQFYTNDNLQFDDHKSKLHSRSDIRLVQQVSFQFIFSKF